MDYKVFIHSNHKQMVGALVGQYALKRNSRHADSFEVEIIDTKDHEFLRRRHGQQEGELLHRWRRFLGIQRAGAQRNQHSELLTQTCWKSLAS